MAAAVMMDNRKRPLEDASALGADSPSKRMQLASPSTHTVNGAHTNTQQARTHASREGDESDEEEQIPAYKGLEAYRKEAIYRQMLESRRDFNRADRKIRNLQSTLASIEDRTEAFNHFWDLLVEDIRILFRKDELLDEHKSALYDVIPFTSGQPSRSAFSASIQERGTAIRAVLSRLSSIAPQSKTPEVGELQVRCHQLAEEASTLRQQSTQSQTQLQRTTDELTETLEKLKRAERRIDRLQSRTVLLSERPSTQAEEEAEQAKLEAAEAERKAAIKRREQAEASGEGSGEPLAANGHDGASREELDQLEKLAQARLDEADQLRQEVVNLRQACEQLQLDLLRIPDDRTRETSLYRDLHGHFTHAQQELERFRGVFDAMDAENTELREQRAEFEKNAQSQAHSQTETLREQLKTRDADVVRLRAQRDELNAELADRRQRESVKTSQTDEMKQLVASKDLRIETLKSEIRRLQMSLAAQRGDSSMVESLKTQGIGEDDVELIATLQARLKTAEDLSDDLKRQLDARASSTTESDLLSQVATLQKDLDGLSALLSGASTTEDVADKLKQQQTRLEQLQDELAAANESTNALCEEVEKLSQAYSQMDQQASGKVMDLSKMEDKVLRLTTEKAKADNKYFAAMRAKDAVENDRRTALRTVERQVKVIERYAEAEQHFASQLAVHEREVTVLRKAVSGYAARIAELERDLKTSRMREAENQQYKTHAEEKLQQCVAQAEQEKAHRLRIEEKFNKMERDLEKAKKQAAQAASVATGSGSNGGAGGKAAKKSVADSEVDFLQALLRCSSCKDRYRDKVITKCLHTFCTPCIEARIQTRQRKCPHCGSSFANSDVQPLYLQ